MSALGQKQTCAAQKVMSAFPPKADMCSAQAHVRFGPEADIRREWGHRPSCGQLSRLSVNRTRIVSGNCFGLITSLLKFSEKISETGGRGSLGSVPFTEKLPDCVLNIG